MACRTLIPQVLVPHVLSIASYLTWQEVACLVATCSGRNRGLSS